MATFREFITVLLIFLFVIATIFPDILHNILVYFNVYKCVSRDVEELRPYYFVTGIISGLTSVYITYQS